MFSKNPFLRAIVLNIAFLILCLGIGGIHYGCLDDFFMSAIVTGTYGGEFGAQTLFVNGAYAYFLKPFYLLFPEVGWYFIFEILAVFAAFTAISYALLCQVGNSFGIIIAMFILACMSPVFYLQLGFTQCAAVLTAAGTLLLYLDTKTNKWSHFCWALLLMIAGVVFRREAFLLGMPFVGLVLVLSWLEAKHVRKKSIVVVLLCFVAYVGLQSFNQSLFSGKDYSYYLAYQGPRSMLGDGAYYDSDDVFDELEERGYSGQDFSLLKRWVFYDTQVFSLDSMQMVVNVIQRNLYDLNCIKLPAALFLCVAKSFFSVNSWCWGILCLVLFVLYPQRASWYTWGTLLLMSLCLSYLLLQNRVVGYVENGIWLYAIACAIPFFKDENDVRIKWTRRLLYLLMLLSMGCFIFSIGTLPSIDNNRLVFATPEKSKSLQQFTEYTESHFDDVFLLPYNTYKEMALYSGSPFIPAKRKNWANIIPLGYWNMNLPGMKKEMNLRGVDNPLRDVVKENVFVLDEDNKIPLIDFYRRHYDVEIAVDTVQKFDTKNLLKYYIVEGEQ